MHLRRNSTANWKASSENRKASSENRKVFSEESEGFFRRVLGLYTHKFPKRGAASLMYLPRSRLDLPRLRLGFPRLRLSRNSGPAMEGFSNRGINFKDAYRMWQRHRFSPIKEGYGIFYGRASTFTTVQCVTFTCDLAQVLLYWTQYYPSSLSTSTGTILLLYCT